MDSRPRPRPGEVPVPKLPDLDQNLYVIHYTQELAAACTDSTPAVSAIIVQHALTGCQETFAAMQIREREGIPPSEFLARHPDLERWLLEEFHAFAAGLPEATWLHWDMRKPHFGFDVLSQRARRHGLDPGEIPPERRFDLACHLKQRYGDDYVSHPRMWHALHRNGAASPGLLSEAEAAAAWAGGNYAAVLRSLSCKVQGIARLYERVRVGTFQVGGIGPPMPEVSGPSVPSALWSPEGEQGPESNRSGPTPAELANALRRAGRKGKALPAALVEFMADRQTAPVEEVAERVHGHHGTDCRRVKANVSRTNKGLETLAADFRFRLSAGYIHKVPAGVWASCRQYVTNKSPKSCQSVALA